jgi:hypothetical protein
LGINEAHARERRSLSVAKASALYNKLGGRTFCKYENAENAFWSKRAPKLTGLTPTVKNLKKSHFPSFVSLFS